MEALRICRLKYLSLIAKKILLKYFYFWKVRHTLGYPKKVTHSTKTIKHSGSINLRSPEKSHYPYKNYNSLTNSPSLGGLSPAKMPSLNSIQSGKTSPHCRSIFDELKATLKNKATIFDPSSNLDLKNKKLIKCTTKAPEKKNLFNARVLHKRNKTMPESALAIVSTAALKNSYKINILSDS